MPARKTMSRRAAVMIVASFVTMGGGLFARRVKISSLRPDVALKVKS